jgi:hypothetical protein
MMKLVLLSLLINGISAFSTPKSPAYRTSLAVSKETIMSSPDTTELGKVWDPLGLADIGSEETLAWYRHSEIKHGRVGEFFSFSDLKNFCLSDFRHQECHYSMFEIH